MEEIKVIALKGFQRAVKKLFSENEISKLAEFLSKNPEAGDLIPKTGGLRKVRWALAGKGKRGGSRVIYYYHCPQQEVLLLTAYAKSDQEDLSEQEKHILKTYIQSLINEGQ